MTETSTNKIKMNLLVLQQFMILLDGFTQFMNLGLKPLGHEL